MKEEKKLPPEVFLFTLLAGLKLMNPKVKNEKEFIESENCVTSLNANPKFNGLKEKEEIIKIIRKEQKKYLATIE